jgi:hypothetical protein
LVTAFILITPLMARLGRAHTLGVSAATFDVGTGGEVEGRLTFASTEALRGLHLDRNHDGTVAAEEVTASEKELSRFVLEGVDVAADGTSCPATFVGAAVDEMDGLVLRTRYRCPEDSVSIGVTFYFLSDLPSAHREIATLTAGESTTQAVLSGSDRAITLTLPAHARSNRRLAWMLLAALATATGAVLVVRRRRVTS